MREKISTRSENPLNQIDLNDDESEVEMQSVDPWQGVDALLMKDRDHRMVVIVEPSECRDKQVTESVLVHLLCNVEYIVDQID